MEKKGGEEEGNGEKRLNWFTVLLQVGSYSLKSGSE